MTIKTVHQVRVRLFTKVGLSYFPLKTNSSEGYSSDK